MSRGNYSVDLIKQMAECDANYIRLLKLVPQLRAYRDGSFADYNNPDPLVSETLTEPQKVLEGQATEFSIAVSDEELARIRVKIEIVEAFKYTTTLLISQRPELEKWVTNPSILVRVYHDANTAEVVSYQGHKNFKARYSQPNSNMYHPDEKMQVNVFLGEWLSHCLKVGISTDTPELMFST